MSYRIPLSYTPIDTVALNDVLARYSQQSHTDIISDFEKAVSHVTGSKYVLALNSGTAAIHLALKALTIQPGDEVLASTFTYVATINPILYERAIPVFIDSEKETWNMDPQLLEHALTSRRKKPKAILLVHSYGMPAKMDDILYLSRKFEVPLIEDAAEAIGSAYKDVHLGTLGEIGILSFNNNKLLTTYGGGALLTNNERIYKQALFRASQARENKPYYEHLEVGYNYRMSSLNAAAGLVNFNKLKALLKNRREVFNGYEKELRNAPYIHFLKEPACATSNRWLTTVLFNDSQVNYLTDIKPVLDKEGIESRPLWKPMHRQPVFENFTAIENGIADNLFRYGMCLPSGELDAISEVSIQLGKITGH